MKAKYLFQALKFACLPTLSVLTLLFFGFFNIRKTLDFIGSDNGWAVFLRILLVILEIALIVIVYYHYEQKGILEDIKKNAGNAVDDKGISISYHDSIYNLFTGQSSNHKFYLHRTDNENISIVTRHPKTNS